MIGLASKTLLPWNSSTTLPVSTPANSATNTCLVAKARKIVTRAGSSDSQVGSGPSIGR